MNSNKDQLYQQRQKSVSSFSFDQQVAQVFDDMISRSVPGYQQILELIPTLARHFKFEEHNYYDLGCSLGAGMMALADGLKDCECKIIGIDSSAAMLAEARPILQTYSEKHHTQFQLEHADLLQVELHNAGLVLMNFTLQFIPLNLRDRLIEGIYSALSPGGALVLSEKVKYDDADTNQLLIDIHHQFKADQGYTDLEISQKRDAIENVLIPEALDKHQKRLQTAGFRIITPWIQNLQFISILAIK